MKGIRVAGQPLFAEIFEPVLTELNGLTWLTGVQAFRCPPAWLEESVYDHATDSYVSGPCADLDRDVHLLAEGNAQYGCYSHADIFPKYASIVEEDWNSIFAFERPVQDPLGWWKGYYDAKKRAAYVVDCHACFLSIDGSYWEFYANEPRLQDTLSEHLKRLDVAVWPCSLEESHGL